MKNDDDDRRRAAGEDEGADPATKTTKKHLCTRRLAFRGHAC